MSPLNEASMHTDTETDEDDEYEYGEEEGEEEEETEDLPLLETPQNPLGYTLPRLRKNENSDWTSLLFDMKKKHRETGNYYAKRFIKQVRESRGYDVDCLVSSIFMSPFRPEPNFKKKKTYYANVKKAAQYAVDKLNGFRSKHKACYKLVDVEKVVTDISGSLLLLTFTVKQITASNAYRLDLDYCYRDCECNQSTVPVDDDDDDGDDHKDKDNDKNKDQDAVDDGEDNKDNGESENKDGIGRILTCQATVDVCWFRKCKGYKLKELRVKPVITKAVPPASAASRNFFGWVQQPFLLLPQFACGIAVLILAVMLYA